MYILKFLIIIIEAFLSLKTLGNIFVTFFGNKNELTITNNIKTIKLLNLTDSNKKENIIKLAIYCDSLKNGGIARNTAILINLLSDIKIFDLYLLTDEINNNEYKISNNVKRINISFNSNILGMKLVKNKINIFIYQSYDKKILDKLKKIKKLKIILYNHSCFLIWIYINDKYITKYFYNEYKKSNFVISIVPFENDFVFKKWGINSIYMDNFLTYDYDKIIPSDLSEKHILMIGRGSDELKRFDLGIIAMKSIIKDIPESQMFIISKDQGFNYIKKLINSLYLEKFINFVGNTSSPDIYFKSASLHIFPSIAEAFPMVLSETKMYGIPNILVGIDYVSNINGGVVIIYDDSPETIAKISIKILNNLEYRKKLSKEARKSMKKFNNNNLFKKWVKLLISINNENYNYQECFHNERKIPDNQSLYILNKQINLLRRRLPRLNKLNINDILNLSFIQNINT